MFRKQKNFLRKALLMKHLKHSGRTSGYPQNQWCGCEHHLWLKKTAVSGTQLLNRALCLGRRPQRVAQRGGTQHTHTHNQKSLYGAGTKGLLAQWPFALQWGVAGMLSPEKGHKHQTVEPSTEGGGRNTCQSVCAHDGNVGSDT